MKKYHILLVDDDLDEFEFFLMALEKMPSLFKCTYAGGGTEALNLLNEIEPDFIFLDMNMPARNGLECLKEIKKIEKYRHIPIIIYSTTIDESIAKKALALGAVQCLTKPILPALLEEILRKMVYDGNELIPNPNP